MRALLIVSVFVLALLGGAAAVDAGSRCSVAVPVPGESHPSWAPDGRKLAYHLATTAGGHRILVYDLRTRRVRLRAWGSEPDWGTGGRIALVARYPLPPRPPQEVPCPGSPTGTCTIVDTCAGLRGQYDLLTTGATAGRPNNLTRSNSTETNPAWSPDGERLAFAVADVDGLAEPAIEGVAPASGERLRITDPPASATDSDPAWSPDGRRIVFVRATMDGATDLYVIELATGVERRLTSTPNAIESRPAWAPTGGRIAFASERSIWTIRVDGTGARRWVGGFDPAWSPDGRRLAFARLERARTLLYVMPATGGRATQLVRR